MENKHYKHIAASILLDKQYHKTVLKVPDVFGLPKGAISKQMQMTGRELFEVNFFSISCWSIYGKLGPISTSVMLIVYL